MTLPDEGRCDIDRSCRLADPTFSGADGYHLRGPLGIYRSDRRSGGHAPQIKRRHQGAGAARITPILNPDACRPPLRLGRGTHAPRPAACVLTLLVAGAAAAFAGRVRGGSLESLAATRLTWLPLLWTALVLQIAPALWLELSGTAAVGVILASNLLLVGFLLLNRKLPGIGLMAAGLLLNVVVIGANRAMPVSGRAADLAGVASTPTQANFEHELMSPSTVLPWLGDVIPLPRLGEVLSLGDLLLVGGIAVLVYRRMLAGPPPAPG